MKGSLKIAKLFGIPVLLHWSFLFLVVAGIYQGHTLGLNWQETKWWSLFAISVFISILLHEFGHALMAKRFGVETKDIVLLPIGGMARLNRLPEKPYQELLVALAGPMVNVLIAVSLFPFFWFVTKPRLMTSDMPSPENIDDSFFLFLPLLLFLNLLLAFFNLIPAFPMDGGRILRALLSIKLGRLKATKLAVIIGIIIALGLIVSGVWSGSISYPLIGVFIAYTAMREYRWVKTENLLASHTVAEVFMQDHRPLSLGDDVQKALDIFLETGQRGFLVFGEIGHLAGTLDIGEIIDLENRPIGRIKDIYKNMLYEISIMATLKEANEMMQQKGCSVLAVMVEEKLAGLLEEEMMWEYLGNEAKPVE